jgi:putative ABC transport system permease protein
VKVLTGVFDPPPQTLSLPWLYLAVLLLAGFASVMLAVLIGGKVAATRTIESLRTI